jgi:hypothetical protein
VTRPPRAPGAYLRLPLWQRFALSLLIAAALLTAMVLYVSGHNTDYQPSADPAAALQANRDAEILVAQDQAPRSVRVRAGEKPEAALERVIHARVARQIAAGAISGPLERAVCRPSGPAAGPRRAFSCTVLAGSVRYPFAGVVDTPARRVTYCKRDPPPVPSEAVAVSRRCRA